jgi:hypothetical protein
MLASLYQAKSLNLAGSAAFTAAVMAVVAGMALVTQPARRSGAALLLAACALLAGAFGFIDRRAAAPLLPAPLVGSPRLREGALRGRDRTGH